MEWSPVASYSALTAPIASANANANAGALRYNPLAQTNANAIKATNPMAASTSYSDPPAVAGTKRPAGDDLQREQRLSKRLEQLTLRARKPPTPPTSPVADASSAAEARMDVDNVVYISTLDTSSDEEDVTEDADLAALPAHKRGLVFLPDIEKRMTAIPTHVLRPDAPSTYPPGLGVGRGQELVLYSSVPRTLKEENGVEGVRKAIIEARARARERSLREEKERREARVDEAAGMDMDVGVGVEAGESQPQVEETDDDAMDVDAMEIE